MSLSEYFSPFSSAGTSGFQSLTAYFKQRVFHVDDIFEAKPPRNPIVKPSGWTIELMPFEGSYIPCYVSRAENEKAYAGLATGMSSTPVDWHTEVELLNQQGISVIGIGLHHTANPARYYELNRRVLDAFYFDENRSPLYRTGDRSLARSAIVHSTSAPIFLHNLSREWAIERKPNSLKSAIYLNPFIDTYNSSVDHHKFKDTLLTTFMLCQRSKAIGVSWLEKKIMGEEATSHDPATYDRPEWNRVRITRAQARKLNKALLNGERADISMFPQKMYLGDKDYQTCSLRAQDIATAIGSETQIYEADHYSIFKNSDALMDMVQRIKKPQLEGIRAKPHEPSSHDYEMTGIPDGMTFA